MNVLPSIRSRLIAIVLATVIPAVLALGLLGYILYDNQKKQLEIDMLQTTRAMVAAVDRNFDIGLNVAQALAGSRSLQDGDFARFHVVASAVLTDRFPGFNFVLSDESGQQLVNTVRPFGAPLSKHGNPDLLRKVFVTGAPLVSNLYIGGVLNLPVVSIEVPVRRNGKVVYVLSCGFSTDSLTRLLTEQHLPEGRMAAVFDSEGVIAARTHMADKLIGRKGIPELLAKMRVQNQGIVEARTLDGLDVIIAFSRSPETGWSVGLSTPWTVVQSEALKRIALVYAMVFVLLTAGVAAGWVIGGNISQSVRDLAASALALGRGEAVVVMDRGPQEAIVVGRTLKAVERELQQYRDHLEELVVQRTAALEASNRELEQFAYVASHDLQEPLRMVVSYVDLLSLRYADHLDAEAREFIGFAREGALRMREQIIDLLQYSRIGRHDGGRTTVNLDEAVKEALSNLKNALEETGGEVMLANGLPAVVGVHVELVNLFQNLIGNALKYARPGEPPRVEISAETNGDGYVVKVADNGIGIDPQYHERIFGMFQRLHSRGEYKGTGIGLAVCKKIVEKHGGRIWIDSSIGKGSTFFVAFPVVIEAAAEASS
ncbi:MAG: ATP-binding protein [Phaeospirillum sp.]|nr:ATP-binding protein [Phaeospirillum sp.]